MESRGAKEVLDRIESIRAACDVLESTVVGLFETREEDARQVDAAEVLELCRTAKRTSTPNPRTRRAANG